MHWWRGIIGILVGALLTFAEPRALLAEEAKAAVVAPSPIGALSVSYPAGAHGDAEVALELVIGEDGTVTRVTVVSGEEPFAEAARLGAQGFRFTPATRGGIPVRARIAVKIGFQEPVTAESPEPTPVKDAEEAAGKRPPSSPAVAAPGEPPQPPPPVEVVVLGEQRVELGSIHIPREEARRVPGAFADPFKVVEALPGVASVLSGLPYYFVRGSRPGDVGYFIDGIRVPLLFHVGPGPSVISPLIVERVDLFPGAYPARFGRYAGAALAGETLSPSQHSRAEGQARVFDASAALEQPFAGGRGNIMLGGRYSYMQAILKLVAPDYELGYWDYQARLSYALSREDRLTLFAFGGFDLLRNAELDRTLFDVGFHRLDLRWDELRANGRIRLGVTLSQDRVLTSPDDSSGQASSQRTRGIRARLEVEQDVAAGLRVRFGGDAAIDRVEGERELFGAEVVRYGTRSDRTGGGWADLVWRPVRGVEIVPGARLDVARSRGENHLFFEPRLATRTRLAAGVAHLAGFGMAHQLPAVTTRMPSRRSSLFEMSEQESIQASQGIEYALPDGMLGRTTLFYQHLHIDLPGVRSRSYGVEQFLRRNFTNRLGGFLSYTLARSEDLGPRGKQSSTHDRTHVVSAVLGYDFGKNYRLGLRGYYASGRPIYVECPTPDCGPGDPNAPFVYERKMRVPGFFRLDFRFEKRWTWPSGFWITATAEWFNVLFAAEPIEYEWTPRGLVQNDQSALALPSLGMELGW